MSSYIFILGRQPAVSVEELLVTLGDKGHITEVQPTYLVYHGECNPLKLLSELGGTIKIARIIEETELSKAFTVDNWLKALRQELDKSEGKFLYGLSIYGGSQRLKQDYHRLGLELKKRIKGIASSVRFVNNKEGVLSSVAVKKNNLLGRELVVVDGEKRYFGLTEAVQDFEAYGKRDYGRPAADPRRGMVPPKLAQIMINLSKSQGDEPLLDPFCGVGTVLQEALMKGFTNVWGSDQDRQAIVLADKNLSWLREEYDLPEAHLKKADATELARSYDSNFFRAAVTEPFLGPAQLLNSGGLTRKQLEETISQLRLLYRSFFKSLYQVIAPGGRAVVIYPVFQLFGGQFEVFEKEAIEKFGWKYERPLSAQYDVIQSHPERPSLFYRRPEQIVAREITVWRK